DAEGVLGARTELRRLARRTEAVHDAIGVDRDLALLAAELPFVAARAAAARENAFVYGMLAERAARRQRKLRETAEHAIARPRQGMGPRPPARAAALFTAEPMPLCAGGTAPRTAEVRGATVAASPNPKTIVPGTTNQSAVAGSRTKDVMTMPIAATSGPAVMNSRGPYFPG